MMPGLGAGPAFLSAATRERWDQFSGSLDSESRLSGLLSRVVQLGMGSANSVQLYPYCFWWQQEPQTSDRCCSRAAEPDMALTVG